jgi:hypothetical protein
MPPKPPRFFPTLALAALWLALYLLWVVVRPPEPDATTQRRGRTPQAESSTTTTGPPLFKIKP